MDKSSLIIGIVICCVGLVLLLQANDMFGFNLEWGKIWPIFVVVGGLFILFGDRKKNEPATYITGTFVILLGLAFLADNYDIFGFNLNWGKIWPAFIILGGLYVIFGHRHKN